MAELSHANPAAPGSRKKVEGGTSRPRSCQGKAGVMLGSGGWCSPKRASGSRKSAGRDAGGQLGKGGTLAAARR
eukprot:scaffold224247_cov15-Tisochrysis_lutea.AAC.2